MQNKIKYQSLLLLSFIIIPSLFANIAFASEGKEQNERGRDNRPVVFGTVSSINGTLLVVTTKNGPREDGIIKTYNVDASNSIVYKNNATSSISSVVVGDNLFIQGTVSGTNVVAKIIRDGVPGRNGNLMDKSRNASSTMQRGERDEKGERKEMGRNNPMFKGDGQPVVEGSVTSINGSILSVLNRNNLVYSVDASNAKVFKGNATSSLSNVVIGDRIIVQGSVNGQSISATLIFDRGIVATNTQDKINNENKPTEKKGIFKTMGGFFSKMFGY